MQQKELGGGLDKFQPNNLNEAQRLDLRLLSGEQMARVNFLYEQMKTCLSKIHIAPIIDELNCLFASLLQ